jgi:polysaccharide pyruvyl transferase WcaK-like protein
MSQSRPRPIFLVHGRYIRRNLGDWLIMRVMLARLLERGEVVCFDRRMKEYDLPGLRAASGRPGSPISALASALTSRLRGRQVYIVYPPGHIFSSSAPSVSSFAKLVIKTALEHVLGAMGVRFMRLGASAGPFNGQDAGYERGSAKRSFYYSVRDSRSERYLKGLGIEGVRRFPDWSLVDPLPAGSAPGFGHPRTSVVLSFRGQLMGTAEDPTYDPSGQARRLARILPSIMDESGAARIVISQQVDQDEPVTRALAVGLEMFQPQISAQTLDWTAAAGLYGSSAVVISNRLHVLLFAMRFGAVPIALIDPRRHDKVMGIFEDAGLTDLVLDVNQDRFDETRLRGIWKNKDRYLSLIQRFFSAAQDQAETELARTLSR